MKKNVYGINIFTRSLKQTQVFLLYKMLLTGNVNSTIQNAPGSHLLVNLYVLATLLYPLYQ